MRALVLSFVALLAATTSQGSASALVVQPNGHAVVLEYEAWFGPHAVTFAGSAAMPLLQSRDMQRVGGGYDSEDPAVIRQHVAWIEAMGFDAVTIDLTNDVSCIFDSQWFVRRYLRHFSNCPALRRDFQQIRENTGNLYPAWSRLRTRLGLIPLLGGIDQNVLYRDVDGKTAFEKEIEYFGARMAAFPERNVVYGGKPLMLVYLGAAQDPNPRDNPLWVQLRRFLTQHPQLTSKYRFQEIAGYLDSQPGLWEQPQVPAGPIEISPEYGFWSVVDRLNPSCRVAYCPYYPTYNLVDGRVQNLTVSIATAGQSGWACPSWSHAVYCPDDALRFDERGRYATFAAFMGYARMLKPTFLIVDQFNEFQSPDEGWNAQTNDDIEPADLWGSSALDAVQAELARYRASL
jgi:hypothetical protein